MLTCQRALRSYVAKCQCALHAYMLTYKHALLAYVLTCQRALHACVLVCQCALHVYVLTCKRAIFSSVNSHIIQICYVYLGLKRGNIGQWLVSLLETFRLSSVPFRSLGGLKMFGEKNLGICTMYIGIAVIPRVCCLIFHFRQF